MSQRERVAVVDGDSRLRAAFERVLCERYDVTTLGSAEDLLAAIDAGSSFAAVLCELDLPGMNALALVAALEERGSPLAERVVLMTADDVAPASFPAPLLLKPFDKVAMFALIERVSGLQSATA